MVILSYCIERCKTQKNSTLCYIQCTYQLTNLCVFLSVLKHIFPKAILVEIFVESDPLGDWTSWMAVGIKDLLARRPLGERYSWGAIILESKPRIERSLLRLIHLVSKRKTVGTKDLLASGPLGEWALWGAILWESEPCSKQSLLKLILLVSERTSWRVDLSKRVDLLVLT